MSAERPVHLTVFRPEMDASGVGKRRNFCRSLVENRKSSMVAKFSPAPALQLGLESRRGMSFKILCLLKFGNK